MHPIIKACTQPIGLYIFPTFPELSQWLNSYKNEIIQAGGRIKLSESSITFPNGGRLYLGHAKTDDDMFKYYGLNYDFIIGGNDFLKSRENV